MADKRDKRYFDRVRDTYDSVSEKLSDTKDKTKEMIQDHPFASVAIAAGIGAIVGILAVETVKMMNRNRR